jgi:hypothetical protein
MALMLRSFADTAEGQSRPPELATGEDGLQAQLFTEEANRQAAEHRSAMA